MRGRHVQHRATLQLGEVICSFAGQVYPGHARTYAGIFRDALPGIAPLIRPRTETNRADGTSRHCLLRLGEPRRIKCTLVVWKTVGRTTERSDYLALDIDPIIVGVIHVGCVDAETDEHDLGRDIRFRAHRVPTHDEIFLPALRFLDVVLVEDESCGIDIDASREHRYLLIPAIITSGLEADFLELSCDIGCRFIVFRRAGHTPHERIIGKVHKVSLDAVTLDQGQTLFKRTGRRLSGDGCTFQNLFFRCFLRTGRKHKRQKKQVVMSVFNIQFGHRLGKIGRHHTSMKCA